MGKRLFPDKFFHLFPAYRRDLFFTKLFHHYPGCSAGFFFAAERDLSLNGGYIRLVDKGLSIFKYIITPSVASPEEFHIIRMPSSDEGCGYYGSNSQKEGKYY